MFKIRSWIAPIVILAFTETVAGAQIPIPPVPADFALMIAQSDNYEVQAGRTAAIQAIDPRVRQFAQQMVDDHTQSSQALSQAASTSGLQPPQKSLSGDQARLLGALQSLTGPAFDRTYIRQLVLAHNAALAVARSYADGGSNSALRAAARQSVPMIEHHLELANKLWSTVGAS